MGRNESCRDCEVCTRSFITRFIRLPLTIGYKLLFSWNYGLFKRHCPVCGHFISQHTGGIGS